MRQLWMVSAMALTLAACSGSEQHSSEQQLRELRGNWVLINYWAQWCKPCIKEIPELNHIDQKLPGVRVVGVNYDGASGKALQTQLSKLSVEFVTLADDPASLLGLSKPAVLPTTLVLDPEGKLHATLLGPQTVESLAAAVGMSTP